MKAANSESGAPGGARTPAPSTVGAIHLGTSARELRLVLSGLMLALRSTMFLAGSALCA